MFEAVLATTSSEGLQPLGSAAQRSFELVRGTVLARLGPDHAALFAEPVATDHGDKIDWYAPMPGAAMPLTELGAAEQAEARRLLSARVADIRAEAERLARGDAPEDQRLSEALANAVEIPGEDMIRVVRGTDGALHPVLLHWAWLRDERRAVRGVLTAMVPRPQPAPDAAGTVGTAGAAVREGGGWRWLIGLGWLLLAALLAMILWLNIAPCGLFPGRLTFCPPPEAEIAAATAETRVIADEIARLERELALVDRGCRATLPREEAQARPTPGGATPEGPERRIAERGGTRGKLDFALEWDTTDDVDLYVTCPAGEVISYRNRTGCGGRHDLDANLRRGDAVSDPVETVTFSDPEPGIYTVRAHLRARRSDAGARVILHVLRADGPSLSYTGKVGPEQAEWITNISISG